MELPQAYGSALARMTQCCFPLTLDHQHCHHHSPMHSPLSQHFLSFVFILPFNDKQTDESNNAWFSVHLCLFTAKLDHTERSLSFSHIPSNFPFYFTSQLSFHRYFGCDLWVAVSHCRWDLKLQTNTQLSQSPSSWSANCACRKLICVEASSLISNLAETGQKMRDKDKMASVSPAGAVNRVKVIRSSHSSL